MLTLCSLTAVSLFYTCPIFRSVYQRNWYPGRKRCHQLWFPQACRDISPQNRSIRKIWTPGSSHQSHYLRWQVFIRIVQSCSQTKEKLIWCFMFWLRIKGLIFKKIKFLILHWVYFVQFSTWILIFVWQVCLTQNWKWIGNRNKAYSKEHRQVSVCSRVPHDEWPWRGRGHTLTARGWTLECPAPIISSLFHHFLSQHAETTCILIRKTFKWKPWRSTYQPNQLSREISVYSHCYLISSWNGIIKRQECTKGK